MLIKNEIGATFCCDTGAILRKTKKEKRMKAKSVANNYRFLIILLLSMIFGAVTGALAPGFPIRLRSSEPYLSV